MLYIPVIAAIENQLKKDHYLQNLRYYRFSIPTSSVKSPFICCPFTQTNEYTSHVHPCIVDTVTHSCVGNFFDQHMITIPILIGAARHESLDADEVLDIIQDAVIEQLKGDRYLEGAVRFSEVDEMIVDNFVEISPNHRGAILDINVKYIDEVDAETPNWIETILGPEIEDLHDWELDAE